MSIDYRKLLEAAMGARDRAYCPYSRFRVGAALMTADGGVYTGANVENVSYGLTMCAERVATGTAVAAGATKFRAIAVVSDRDAFLPPCGACRQVLAEFGGDVEVVMGTAAGDYKVLKLSELLPVTFDKKLL